MNKKIKEKKNLKKNLNIWTKIFIYFEHSLTLDKFSICLFIYFSFLTLTFYLPCYFLYLLETCPSSMLGSSIGIRKQDHSFLFLFSGFSVWMYKLLLEVFGWYPSLWMPWKPLNCYPKFCYFYSKLQALASSRTTLHVLYLICYLQLRAGESYQPIYKH